MSESRKASAGQVGGAAPADADLRAAPGTSFVVPRWAADAGRWSWISIGVLILLVAILALAAATRVLVISALFAVLLGCTAGSLLFGAIGGVFAAPFLKIGLDAVARLKAAGIFSDEAAVPSLESGPPASQPRALGPSLEGEG